MKSAARRTSTVVTLPGQHWGHWLERSAQAAGYPTKAELARAVGVHRKSIQRWYADALPPMESDHLNLLAKALGITTKELIAGAGESPVVAVPAGVLPSEDALRSALAAQLAAYARHLDVPQLLELVRAGAVMARQGANESNHVGDAGQGTGEGHRAVSPDLVEVDQVTHVQPAASLPARRVLSSHPGRAHARPPAIDSARGKP